jgi:Cu(I)/Ag(I) efflux system membrane fusion protein
MYVNTGTQIYTIADLSRVWVKLEAYESDITWIRYGQKVEILTESYPGERFEGRISFIDPTLNAKTRTVAVRVNVENIDGRLKPGMFVKGIVYSRVSAGGKVVEPDLAGKWISPMHPEIIKDRPGKCDICGMPLVQTEMLGYAAAEPKDAPIVIPVTVPLITGKRAVVYVRSPDNNTMFEGREVVLGPRAGNYYIVLKGLHEGESVVVNGNFKIDSAMQIEAKPSMMNPEGGGMGAVHKH